jgi:hypothetical protein
MSNNILNLELLLKKKASNLNNVYYYELCCPNIVELINDCPGTDNIGLLFRRFFKINNTIFNIQSIEIKYINLTNNLQNETEKYILEDTCIVDIITDKIERVNKICIKKLLIKVVPKCLNFNNIHDRDIGDNIDKIKLCSVCKSVVYKKNDELRDCFELYFLDEEGKKGDKVRIVKEGDNVGVKLLKDYAEWNWVARAGGASSSYDIGLGISAGPDGVFVTGKITPIGLIDFYDHGETVSNGLSFGPVVPVGSSYEVFVAKINTEGVWEWVARAGGTGIDEGLGISAGPDGVFVTGRINANGPINFYDHGETVSKGLSFGPVVPVGSSDNDEVFVAKLNTEGKWNWVARAGGTSSDVGFGISAGPDGVFVTGLINANGPINFYDHGETVSKGLSFGPVGSSDNDEVFVAKLNTEGKWDWVARAGGTSIDAGRGISAGPDGVFVTGRINAKGPINFYDHDETVSKGLSFGPVGSSDYPEVFVAKLNTEGEWVWVARAGGTSYDVGYRISAGPDGVFVTGQINADGPINFYDHDETVSKGLSFGPVGSSDNPEVFVAKLNTEGKWDWVARAGGTEYDEGYGISAGPDGVFVTGHITADGPINFYDQGETISNGLSFGPVGSSFDPEVFVAKLNDNTAYIVGQLYSDSENGKKTYVCFPDYKVEKRDSLKPGKNYYLDKDDKITEESFFNTFYGTAVSTNKLILYKK